MHAIAVRRKRHTHTNRIERKRGGEHQEKLGHTSTIKDQDTEINLINAFNAPKRKFI